MTSEIIAEIVANLKERYFETDTEYSDELLDWMNDNGAELDWLDA